MMTMAACRGGLNEGVWFMYGEEDLALKLVKCQRIACNAHHLQKATQHIWKIVQMKRAQRILKG